MYQTTIWEGKNVSKVIYWSLLSIRYYLSEKDYLFCDPSWTRLNISRTNPIIFTFPIYSYRTAQLNFCGAVFYTRNFFVCNLFREYPSFSIYHVLTPVFGRKGGKTKKGARDLLLGLDTNLMIYEQRKITDMYIVIFSSF